RGPACGPATPRAGAQAHRGGQRSGRLGARRPSLNQCDGDAPMIIVALVSDRPIIELEDEQPTAFRLGRE
ncbi:hypothetical protein ACWECR_39650, partial [Streptomyces sp. NPDC005056]